MSEVQCGDQNILMPLEGGRRVLVCGGRKYNGRQYVFDALDRLNREEPIGVIIHGACCDWQGQLRGADRWAEEWAILREVIYVGAPAKWAKQGKPAGMIRNEFMADNLNPDLVVAFPGGSGTAGMLKAAKERLIQTLDLSKTSGVL